MRRTILLADDSPTIQRLVTNTFADSNYDIVSVSNGEAAIRKFEEVQPSVVLADIYMPGRTGYEVCAYVRHHPSLSSIPVILLVGAFDAFDEHKAKELGATANITKPFEPRALVSLVESVIPDTMPVGTPPPVREAPAVVSAEIPEVPAPEVPAVPAAEGDGSTDLLGLESLFRSNEPQPISTVLTDDDIDRIAERVMKRLSSEVIEGMAWEIVPDIADKVVREQSKKNP